MQLRAGRADDELGVVTRADRVETKCERLVEHGRELDALIAAQARIRCAAGRVFVDEVFDHVVGKALGEIPYVEGNPEHIGGALCIAGVFEGAATASAGPVRLRRSRQSQMDAGDVMPGVDCAGRGHG